MAIDSTGQMTQPEYSGDDKALGSTEEKCPYPKEENESVKEKYKPKLRVSLFFDGTLNNRANVRIGAANAKFMSNRGSYENDFSNISKLEQFWRNDNGSDSSTSIYIEGIGTQNDGTDVPQGMVEGRGITGVKAKVESSINQIVTWVDELEIVDKEIDHIYLDTFGFSRGAAAARFFIYAALHESGKALKDRLVAKGYLVGDIKVKFVGLFDTVASYGFKHTNDTKDLHLDAISNAEYVLQLAAAEEHRKNFRLTNIKSALSGLEIFLPGVHSDVGGGYADNASEVDRQILDIDTIWTGDDVKAAFQRDKKWVIAAGWFSVDEIQDSSSWNELKATRHNINNKYSHIPLNLMKKLALEKGMNFAKGIATRYNIPDDLSDIKTAIDTYVAGLEVSCPEDWFELNNEMMKKARHGYFHFSAYYGSTNAPQFTEDDPVKGKRKRTIQRG